MAVTYESIATSTLTSAASSITFSSISGSYTDLRLSLTTANVSAALTYVVLQFNSDSGTTYSRTRIYGNGTTALANRSSGDISLTIGTTTANASNFCYIGADILSYSSPTPYKTILSESAADNNGSGQVNRIVSLWKSTSPITSIKILLDSGSNMAVGTIATLYGIKAA